MNQGGKWGEWGVEGGVEGERLKLTASFAICSGCSSIQALHTCAACRRDADRQASSHHIRLGYLRIACNQGRSWHPTAPGKGRKVLARVKQMDAVLYVCTCSCSAHMTA